MEYDSVMKLQEELGYYKKYCQQLENQNAALNQQLFNNVQGNHQECEARLKMMERQLKQKLMEEQLWLKKFESQLGQIVELKAAHQQFITETKVEEEQKQKEIDILKEEIEHYQKQIEIYKIESCSQIYAEEVKEMRRQLEASEIKLEELTRELQLRDQQLNQFKGKQSLTRFKNKFDIELKNENLSTEPDISSNSFSNIMLRDI